jgi:chromosome segregation ATPase
MKQLITLALLIALQCFGVRAQLPIVLSDDTIAIGTSSMPAISVDIPEVDYDKALKEWVKTLQTGTKSKVVTENNEMSIFGARIKPISSNTLNVYSRMTRMDQAVRLSAAFELRKDQYIDKASGAAEYINAQKYLKEFAKARYIELAKEQADVEEKKLRNLEKELRSLEKEKSKLKKSIQSDNSNIMSQRESVVTTQNNELPAIGAALEQARAEYATMEEGPAKKEKEVAIKDLEKRQKKALRSIESSEKKIEKSTSSIREANSDIPKNEKMQENVREQISQQNAVYQSYVDKLKKIRSF